MIWIKFMLVLVDSIYMHMFRYFYIMISYIKQKQNTRVHKYKKMGKGGDIMSCHIVFELLDFNLKLSTIGFIVPKICCFILLTLCLPDEENFVLRRLFNTSFWGQVSLWWIEIPCRIHYFDNKLQTYSHYDHKMS